MDKYMNLFLFLLKKRHAVICILMILIYQYGNSQCTVDAGEDIHICLDQSGNFDNVRINASILGGIEPYTIKWLYSYKFSGVHIIERGSDILNDTTLLNPLVVQRPLLSSTYLTISVTDGSGNTCVDSMMYSYSLFEMTLEDRRSFISKGDTTSIHSNVKSGFPPYTYKWTPNYNISDTTANAPFVWPEHDQSYLVTVTDSTGCQYILPWEILVSSTNVEEQKSNVFKAYPNPVTGTLSFENVSKSLQNAVVYITDVNGRSVINEELDNDCIDVNPLPEGVYYYTISNRNQIIHSGSFIKQ